MSDVGFAWEAGEDMNALTGGKALSGAGDLYNTQTFDSDAGKVVFGMDIPEWTYPAAVVGAVLVLLLWIKKK